ncbi:MAG: sulfotransferase domain-containing protein [Phycisphaerae bacterium]|nr:sulfotransferase domain-containing protein [Phycisphaerae bacterium]
MARPEVIREGSAPQPPLLKRALRKARRVFAMYRLEQEKRRYRRDHPSESAPRVAFVLGCQRSGTNMVLRTLNRSLEADGIEETDPRAFCDCRFKDKSTRETLVAGSTARCIIFKPICDSHNALEMLSDHPGSKIIWIYRHYLDVATSSVVYWGDQLQTYIEDLFDGGGDWDVAQWNREKVSSECIQEMREASAGRPSPHGAAALFWYMRNRTYFDQELQNSPDAMLVRYEDVVTDPDHYFQRMCAFLDVQFRPEMVADVFSSSVRRRKSPPIKDSIITLCDRMWDRLNRAREGAGRTEVAAVGLQ